MLKSSFVKELDPNTEKNIVVSVRDAMAHSAMVGSTEQYLGAYGLFLKASTLQIGILSALPPLFAAFCQLFSLKALENTKSRRFLIVSGSRLQALIFIPIMLLPFLFDTYEEAVPVLIFSVLFYHGTFGFTVPVWNSLIGDLIPADYRGRFFGLRNQRMGLCTFLAMILAGGILDFFSKHNLTAWGFFCIFVLAGIYKLISVYWVNRYDDPEYISKKEAYFSFWQFISRIGYANFTRFVFFAATIQGIAAFSAPYFAIYFLDVLKMTYAEFTLVMATPTIIQIITLQNWGRLVERFGSKKILTVCSFGVAINPILWLISSQLWVALLIQIFSGFVWSGFNLAVSTFLFDAVTPAKRARCCAYQSLIQAVFVLLGSLAGAFLVERIPPKINFIIFDWEPLSPFLLIFLLSGIFRLIAAIVYRQLFKEVREVETAKASDLLFHFFPITEAMDQIQIGFLSRKKKEKEHPKK